MTTLTMKQRRADFEAMLAHAERARQAISKFWATEEDTPGKPVASLARDVAELCASWAAAAKRAKEGHPPSDQAKNLATLVAARCLQALSERDPDGYLEPILKMIGYELRDRDLGMDPAERIGWLLSALGDLASCYHQGYDPSGEIIVYRLHDLLFEAICAALAAERGLWQEES
jgi:hypothetical protein|nr:MAG TPA: hypothetical protein [Caudoviricetes sp.]